MVGTWRREPPGSIGWPADLVMLAMGTSSVPEQLGGVLMLDEAKEFDLGAARKVLAQRITAIPRLRQLLRAAPPLCGNPIWVNDATLRRGTTRSRARRVPGAR